MMPDRGGLSDRGGVPNGGVVAGRRRWGGVVLGVVAIVTVGLLAMWGEGGSELSAQSDVTSVSVIAPAGLPVTVGDSVVAAASIGPSTARPPGATLQFFLCGPSIVTPGIGCGAGAGVAVGVAQAALPAGTNFSAAAVLTGQGIWCFGVLLQPSSGVDTYVTDFAGSCVTAEAVALEIATVAAPGGTVIATAVTTTDVATLRGAAGAPTGTVRFFLCGPSEVTLGAGCVAPAGVQVGGPVVLVAGEAMSAPQEVSEGGRHCWRAEYSGDAAYAAVAHTDAQSECFTQVIPIPPDEIDETLDTVLDLRTDREGDFYEAATPDGSVRVRVRDLPPGVDAFRLTFRPLAGTELGAIVDALDPADTALARTGTSVALAGEVLLLEAGGGAKLPATIEVILAPLAVEEVQFLLWLVEQADGSLAPVEFIAEVDGTLSARFPFDLIFLILDMPAPANNLRAGLNAVVYTGPQMPADRAFPGGAGRGDGIEALWRFSGFGFEAFFPGTPSLAQTTYRLYDPLFVVAGAGGALMQQGLLAPVRRTVSLASGNNLVAYTGAGGSILNVAGGAVVGRAQAIWVWRDSVGRWLGFFPGAPSAVQGISALALGDLIFINASGPVGWDMR